MPFDVAVDEAEEDHIERLLAIKARCEQLEARNEELLQQLTDSQLRVAEKTTFIEQQKETMSRLQLSISTLQKKHEDSIAALRSKHEETLRRAVESWKQERAEMEWKHRNELHTLQDRLDEAQCMFYVTSSPLNFVRAEPLCFVLIFKNRTQR